MDITEMLRSGFLRVEKLNPDNTYIFKLGNDNYMPTNDDLINFRELIETMTKEEKDKFPAIIVSHNMIGKIEEKISYPKKMSGKFNRLKVVE